MHFIATETQIGDADFVGSGWLLAGRYDDRHAADALALVQPKFRLWISRLLQSRAFPRAVRARARPVLLRCVGDLAMVMPDATARSPRREARLAGAPAAVTVLRCDGQLLASSAVADDPHDVQRG